MKKQLTLAALLLICLIGVTAFASSYSMMRLAAPGIYQNTAGGVGRVVQIEVYDSAVASGTVTLYKTVPGSSSTNLEYTVTCSGGKAVVAITNSTFYIAGGDTITRAGTATNGTVRLVLE